MNTRNEYPLVSIITVNYNQSDISMQLLESLRKISYPNIEILVVDNASPTDNPQVIKDRYPEIKFIQSKENLGFAGGNNLAVFESKGDYLLFINNDTEVPENFLEPLVARMESDPKIGVVSPKIIFHHTPDTIQFAGYTPMNPFTIRNNLIGYRQKDDGRFDEAKQTPFGHGAAMLVKREVIKKVGLMFDFYFLYYEEHDWFERIKKAGYIIYYEPASFILHKESISTGKNSPLKIYYIARNRIIFMRRNFNGFQLFIATLFQVFLSIPKNYITYSIKRDWKLLKAFHNAMIWNLKHTFDRKIFENVQCQNKSL